jgi:aspartyl-tRNA(Asn)/glutamyl-tRNA(Gln) amidotransferase subunit A
MPVSTDVLFLSAREQGALIRAKKLSPVELTDAYLARIESLNPRTNAFITVTADVARDQAAEAEREIGRGRYRGPLHGIPYAPKDILATRGILTTNGSKVTATVVPDYESTITDRLARAGAVLAGKLNLLEFAMGSGVVSGFGPSRNPWDLARSPAGSSSGSGTALAAAMVPLSIGTDTGGSIRGPANFCGIVGLKQTYGRVSRYGVTTLAWSLDHAGPMTRTVADAALMLQAIAGYDPLDPSTTTDPVPDYSRALTGDIRGVRVGVPTRFFADGLAAEIDRAYRAALKTIQGLGAALVDVDVPHAEYATNAGWIVAMAEAAAFHEQRLEASPQLFDPIVRERLDAARFYAATDYIKAQRVRTLLMQEMATVFTLCDVMAVPAGTALPGLLEPPEAAGTDVKTGSKPGRFRGGTTFLGNMTGLPALVLPCGFSAGPPALPIGLQLYGRAFDEASIFRVGHAYEQATEWHKRRPALA